MSRLRCITLWSVTEVDAQTAEWMASARTAGTRARIRCWARVETISVVLMLASFTALMIAPFVTLALAIWFSVARIDRTDVYWWLWGINLSVLAVGAIASAISSEKRRQACFADGYASLGRVDEVIEHPGSGEEQTWYEVFVSTELQERLVLRRNLYWPDDGNDPRRLIGRPISFRHNTLDPGDVHDVLFDGLPGVGRKSRRGR